jgi:hypothetical protein
VPGISLEHNSNHQQMDSLGYGSTNPLRHATKTIRILVNDRRDYLVGIILLLAVVFLWTLSSFIIQVRTTFFGPMHC